MSGYLAGLVRRVLDPPGDVRPRAASPFEPGQLTDVSTDDVGVAIEHQSSPRTSPVSVPRSEPVESHDRSEVRAPDERRPAVVVRALNEEARRAIARQDVEDARLDSQEHRSPRAEPPSRARPRQTARVADAVASRAVHARSHAPSHDETHAERSPDVEGPAPSITGAPQRAPSLPATVAATLNLPRAVLADDAPTAHEPPVVHVSIGRIEVRAAQPDAPQPAPRRAEPSHVPLSEYLRQRDAGTR